MQHLLCSLEELTIKHDDDLASRVNYDGDLANGVENGNGREICANGRTYHGEWRCGFKSGFGVEEHMGQVYRGQWQGGVRNGEGVFTWLDWEAGNRIYDGQWRDGKRSGQGVLKVNDDYGVMTFDGQWLDNSPHGDGSITWEDGARFEGTWRGGKRHGHGVQTFNTGASYTGQYKRDKKHGKGVYVSINQNTYEGEFRNDEFHGNGIMTHKEMTYTGEWKDSLRHGHGVLVEKNGTRYVGQFKKGKRSGDGTLVVKRSGGTLWTKYVGQWKDDQMSGSGRRTAPFHAYDGQWLGGMRHGVGTFTFEGGSYVGEWRDDKRNGKGTETVDDGDGIFYTGQWRDDKREGEGTLKADRGRYYYSGQWLDGNKHGAGVEMFEEYDGNKFGGGIKFTGSWRDGKCEGPCVISMTHNVIECEMKANRVMGDRVKMKFTDGATYVGQLKGLLREGHGRETSSTRVYSGQWMRDRPNGRGYARWSDGTTYTGQWKDDAPHGQGIRVAPDGSKHEGVFVPETCYEEAEEEPRSEGSLWPDGRAYSFTTTSAAAAAAAAAAADKRRRKKNKKKKKKNNNAAGATASSLSRRTSSRMTHQLQTLCRRVTTALTRVAIARWRTAALHAAASEPPGARLSWQRLSAAIATKTRQSNLRQLRSVKHREQEKARQDSLRQLRQRKHRRQKAALAQLPAGGGGSHVGAKSVWVQCLLHGDGCESARLPMRPLSHAIFRRVCRWSPSLRAARERLLRCLHGRNWDCQTGDLRVYLRNGGTRARAYDVSKALYDDLLQNRRLREALQKEPEFADFGVQVEVVCGGGTATLLTYMQRESPVKLPWCFLSKQK